MLESAGHNAFGNMFGAMRKLCLEGPKTTCANDRVPTKRKIGWWNLDKSLES